MAAFFLCLFFMTYLGSCSTPAKYATAGQDIQRTLNQSIQTDSGFIDRIPPPSRTLDSALLPPLSVQLPANTDQPQEDRFNVVANAIPAKTFFMSLVAGTAYNMLIDPDITGAVTLNLKNVTLEQTLEATRELYGYEYTKTSLGYEILPAKMTTQIFTVNYLNVKRSGESQTQLVSTDITVGGGGSGSSGGSSGSGSSGSSSGSGTQGSTSTVTTKEDNDFWPNLKTTLETLIGTKGGRWVLVNPQASVIMVHAYPNELHQISEYLDTIQDNLQREVIIEAKILEITLNDSYQAGINWKLLTAHQNGSMGLSSGGQLFSMAFSAAHGDFTSMINLLSQQGNIQVLSSPRISTINNQEAVIKVGSDQFFVTGYTSNITPTGSTNTTSQGVSLNPFFSGITLDVTPQISSDGSITLYIHPSISTVREESKSIQLSSGGGSSTNSTLTLPLASSTIRESDNIVRAQNGQIVVIGGLMQNQTSEVIGGTPGISSIPFAGALARNTNQISAKTELVILLRPIVVDNDQTWTNQLQNDAGNFKNVQRGFHLGALPNDFGTEGEMNH